MKYADSEYRWVFVANRKVPVHMLMNALGHLMLAMQSLCRDEEARRTHLYAEPGGTPYAQISHWPVIILEARNSNQLRTLRTTALEAGMPCQAFVDTMFGASADEQLQRTRTTEEQNVEYVAVLLFGKSEDLGMTRKFSVFSSGADGCRQPYHILDPH